MDPIERRLTWRHLIEPPVFLWIFAMTISGTIFTDLVIYRTCRTLLAPNNTNCSILHDKSNSPEAIHLQELVQPYVSTTLILKSLCDLLIPAFLTLFIGPWSDKFGRKPILLVSLIGPCLMYTMLASISEFDVDTKYLLLASLPYALAGGFSGLFTSALCYVADITDQAVRPKRLVIMDATINFGILCGTFAGPALFNLFGYATVFAVAALSCFFGFVYVIFFLAESVSHINSFLQISVRNFIDLQVIRDLYETITKPKIGLKRLVVACCTICLMLHIFIIAGEGSISYMFTTTRLGWNVSDYSYYSAVTVIVGIISGITSFKLLQSLFGFSETLIIIIASMFNFTSKVIFAYTMESWNIFLASILGAFGGLGIPLIRSVLSKSIPFQDVGKIFSITIFLESLMAAAASPLYTEIYMKYMPPSHYPCPVWLVSAMSIAIISIFIVVVHLRLNKIDQVPYQPQNAAEDAE